MEHAIWKALVIGMLLDEMQANTERVVREFLLDMEEYRRA